MRFSREKPQNVIFSSGRCFILFGMSVTAHKGRHFLTIKMVKIRKLPKIKARNGCYKK
jgi:hypothetical protein